MSFPKNAFLLFSGNGGEVSSGQTQVSAWGGTSPHGCTRGSAKSSRWAHWPKACLSSLAKPGVKRVVFSGLRIAPMPYMKFSGSFTV